MWSSGLVPTKPRGTPRPPPRQTRLPGTRPELLQTAHPPAQKGEGGEGVPVLTKWLPYSLRALLGAWDPRAWSSREASSIVRAH